MIRCIYCNKEKDEKEFSQEHVLPKAIGGVLQPVNPFSTNLVCARCNSISGFFIDAPFSKSWFINNYRASNAAKLTKITPTTILPLVYMGTMKDFNFKTQICENYLGPTGDTIYHFHDPYPIELDSPTMIGVPPHIRKKKIDNGFAFIFIRSNNPQWLPTIFYSFVDTFKDSVLYFGNGPTPNVEGANFKDIPDELKELHDKLWDLQDKAHEITFSMDIDTGNRFLAKLALGLGCIFLHDSFKTSEDAAILRKYLWTKEKEERDKIPIHGSSFIGGGEMKNVNQFLKWEGGHVINLISLRETLALYTNFYGANGSVIQISQNKEHWKGIVNESMMFIVIPEMQRFVGPIHMAELLGHRNSDYKNEELLKLEEEMASIPPLPPFKVEKGFR